MRRLVFVVAVLAVARPCFSEAPVVSPDPLLVEARVFVNAISDIDSVEQTFKADFLLTLSWEPLENEDPEDPDGWYDVVCMNSYDMEGERYPQEGYSYSRKHGTFSAPMNLRKFPFDTQTLSIILEPWSERSEFMFGYNSGPKHPEVRLADGPATLDLKQVTNQTDLLEWTIRRFQVRESASSYELLEASYSRLQFDIEVSRKPGYFIWKVFAVVFLNVLLSWLVFLIDPSELGTRLGVSISLFLAAIAFGIVTSSLIPRISYLTLLDYYVLGSYLIIGLVSLENIAVYVLHKSTRPGWTANRGQALAQTVDRWALFVFPVAFIGLHIGLVVSVL